MILVIVLCTASTCSEMELYDPFMSSTACEINQSMLGQNYAALTGMRLESTRCEKPEVEA